jgi:hypothetical protein
MGSGSEHDGEFHDEDESDEDGYQSDSSDGSPSSEESIESQHSPILLRNFSGAEVVAETMPEVYEHDRVVQDSLQIVIPGSPKSDSDDASVQYVCHTAQYNSPPYADISDAQAVDTQVREREEERSQIESQNPKHDENSRAVGGGQSQQIVSQNPKHDENSRAVGGGQSQKKKEPKNKKQAAVDYVPSRLGLNAEDLRRKDKLLRNAVPQHPVHSKKMTILNQLKDVDKAESQAKEDSISQFMMLQRSQEIHHKEEMKRLDIQKEKEDRRWQEEKDLRREELQLQRAKMDEDRDLRREELRQQREKLESQQRNHFLLFQAALVGMSTVTGNPQVAAVSQGFAAAAAASFNQNAPVDMQPPARE